jgi:hypothetical protein
LIFLKNPRRARRAHRSSRDDPAASLLIEALHRPMAGINRSVDSNRNGTLHSLGIVR